MTDTDNKTPAVDSQLRVGLIADADETPLLAEAVRACRAFELRAQAGMPQNAAAPDVQWFDDTRVMIAQGEIDALVVATSPCTGVSVGDVAVAHGVHVWRRPPLGRNFAEAVEVARRLEGIAVVYRLASWWDHVEAQVRWALGLEDGCKPVFSEVQVSAAGPPLQSWRSSQVDAGGGVLAYDAYGALEALTVLRGLPESVVGAISKCRRRPSEAPRETEDVANVIFRYENGGVACVRAAWDIPPFGQTSLHHGAEGGVRYSERSVAALTADGAVLEERSLPSGALAAEMTRFAAEITGERQREPTEASINRHLAVSALLEAAYLSSRTGQPEIPRRLFEVQKWPEPKC
jgi:predicted dehydrogenase